MYRTLLTSLILMFIFANCALVKNTEAEAEEREEKEGRIRRKRRKKNRKGKQSNAPTTYHH